MGNTIFRVAVPDQLMEAIVRQISIDLLVPSTLSSGRNYFFLKFRSNYNMESSFLAIKTNGGMSIVRSIVTVCKVSVERKSGAAEVLVPGELQECETRAQDGGYEVQLPAIKGNDELAFVGFELDSAGQRDVRLDVAIRRRDLEDYPRSFEIHVPTHLCVDSYLIPCANGLQTLQTLLASTEPIKISKFSLTVDGMDDKGKILTMKPG